MSSDFADMLKDTLSKMQDRIEFANGKDYDDEKWNIEYWDKYLNEVTNTTKV